MPHDNAAANRLPLLREVVEAALQTHAFDTPADRDAVLLQLRPAVASAVPRSTSMRADTMHIVSTCVRYAGGLTELAEAIRFFAGDSIAMSHLDDAIARYLASA